jgi:hypothetical protein
VKGFEMIVISNDSLSLGRTWASDATEDEHAELSQHEIEERIRMRAISRAAKKIEKKLRILSLCKKGTLRQAFRMSTHGNGQTFPEWCREAWEKSDSTLSYAKWKRGEEEKRRHVSLEFEHSKESNFFLELSVHALVASLDTDKYSSRLLVAERLDEKAHSVLRASGHMKLFYLYRNLRDWRPDDQGASYE